MRRRTSVSPLAVWPLTRCAPHSPSSQRTLRIAPMGRAVDAVGCEGCVDRVSAVGVPNIAPQSLALGAVIGHGLSVPPAHPPGWFGNRATCSGRWNRWRRGPEHRSRRTRRWPPGCRGCGGAPNRRQRRSHSRLAPSRIRGTRWEPSGIAPHCVSLSRRKRVAPASRARPLQRRPSSPRARRSRCC